MEICFDISCESSVDDSHEMPKTNFVSENENELDKLKMSSGANYRRRFIGQTLPLYKSFIEYIAICYRLWLASS